MGHSTSSDSASRSFSLVPGGNRNPLPDDGTGFRQFDHSVIVVKSLDSAEREFRKFGFNTAPRMDHSSMLGTSNVLIMFQSNFLELLGFRYPTETSRPWREFADGLAGIYFNALFTVDEEGDVREFTQKGVAAQLTGDDFITRDFTLPDGSKDLVRYRAWTTRYEHESMALFASHQYRPDLIWIPEWQIHPNQAHRLRQLVFVSNAPETHRDYYEVLIGNGSTSLEGERLTVSLSDGVTFVVASPGEISDLYSGFKLRRNPRVSDHAIAAQIEVADLGVLEQILLSNNVDFKKRDRRMVLRPATVPGLLLDFVECE